MRPTRTGRDHPRIRGEHVVPLGVGDHPGGSSPHTRGAPPPPGVTVARETDHPRIRGEHGGSVAPVVSCPGSSPHTRGAPSCPVLAVPGIGIIPAYAGSTAFETVTATALGDHPRIRGEHT